MHKWFILFLSGLFLPWMMPETARADRYNVTLQECIRMAQEESPGAKVVENEFQMRHWQYRAFQASFFPQLRMTAEAPGLVRAINPILQDDGSVRYQTQSQAQSSLGLSLNQAIPMTGGDISITSGINRVDLFGSTQEYLWRATPIVLGITQPVFQFNADKWNREIEALRYSSRKKQYVENKLDIALNVTRQFFDLYLARINLQIAQFNASINDTIYTISQGRYQVGSIAENDLLQSELALMNARTQMQSATLEYQRAGEELKITLGLSRYDSIRVIPPLDCPVLDIGPGVAVKMANQNRSTMTDLEINRLETQRELARAKSETGLTATVIANFGYNKSAEDFANLYSDPREQQFVNIQFELPVFQWGQGRADIEAARATREMVEYNTRIQQQRFNQEVRFQVEELEQLQAQVQLDARADTIAQRRFEVTKNRYLIGKVDITNMQIAQNERDRARRSYFQTLRNYWTAYYQLQRLTLYDFQWDKPLQFATPVSD